MATTLAPRTARPTITLVPPLRPADREGPGRRLLNILVATVGLVLTMPLMLAIAVLIKLTSRGPVLFRQARVGLDRRALSRMGGNTRRRTDIGGHPYTMYKFRTMYVANRGADRQVWAQPDDARVTPLGRLLRRFRLDELPQLFNVLKGDMNVVGPRPEQPAIFVDLREQIEGYQRRQRVRPGITGWAQINLPYDRTVDDVRRKLRSEEHTSELQSRLHLVCRLLLEKK